LIVKFATQLLVILLIVSLVSVIATSTFLYVFQLNSQKEQLLITLESISLLGADNISNLLDEREKDITNLTKVSVLVTSVRDLKNPELSSQEKFQSKFQLEEFSVLTHNSLYWLEGLKISYPDTGEMIFEFGDAPTENLREQQHFIDALNGNTALSEIYSSKEPILNEFGEYEKDVPTLLISSPIYSETELEGVLTARVNVFEIDLGVIKYVSDFNSGDAYIVNSDGLFLSRAAFPQDIVNFVERRSELELSVFDPVNQEFTKLFQNADKNKPITITDGYNDYRGISVIGSINSIENTDWFLIFEIDEFEAYREFIALGIIVGYLLSIVSLAVFVISLHFSKIFARPIISLQESAEQITKGNFDLPITAKGSFETMKLSKSMEQMRKSIKVSLENEQELFIAQQQSEVDNTIAKEKEEFVAMITHDLKQPLVPISGNAEMLNNPKMGELNEMQKDCVSEIIANANLQLSMIDNLISAQKLGAGAMKYDIEELSTKNILKEAIKTHTPAMTDKDIEYFDSSTIDIKVKGDNKRIQESFTNLIQNAHDFVPEKGKIEVGVNDGEKEVTFFVKDNGEGIPKEKQNKLFKKYGQVESKAKRKYGGTGLGLAVSQQLVEGMGGKIWVESEEGKGTTFYFTIPKAD
jgi:signal transduction histidine kinase